MRYIYIAIVSVILFGCSTIDTGEPAPEKQLEIEDQGKAEENAVTEETPVKDEEALEDQPGEETDAAAESPPAVEEKIGADQSENDEMESTEPESMEPIISEPVIRIVKLITRETSLFPDGEIDRFREFEYEKDRLKSEEYYDGPSGALLERTIYEYSNGNLIGKTTRTPAGQVKVRHLYEYDEQQRLVRDTLMDGNGNTQSSAVYGYNSAGRKTLWKTYDKNDILLAVTHYLYDENGKLIEIQLEGIDGTLEQRILVFYDDGERKSLENYLTGDGELLEKHRYEYVDGRLALKSVSDRKELVTSKTTYEYSEIDGKIIERRTRYNKKNRIREIVVREFVQIGIIDGE